MMTFKERMRVRVTGIENKFGNKLFDGKEGIVRRVFKLEDLVKKKWVSPHRTIEVEFFRPVRVTENMSYSIWRFSPKNLYVTP